MIRDNFLKPVLLSGLFAMVSLAYVTEPMARNLNLKNSGDSLVIEDRTGGADNFKVTVGADGTGKVEVSRESLDLKDATSGGTQNFYNSGATNKITVKAPAGLSGSTVYTLPDNDGSAGQVLITDGSGNLSWVTP